MWTLWSADAQSEMFWLEQCGMRVIVPGTNITSKTGGNLFFNNVTRNGVSAILSSHTLARYVACCGGCEYALGYQV